MASINRHPAGGEKSDEPLQRLDRRDSGYRVLVCYVGLMVINLVWASFILNDQVFSSLTRTSLHATEYWTLSWFVASIATVGGALGTGLDQSAASTSRLMPPRPGRQVAPKSWAGRSRHSTHCG